MENIGCFLDEDESFAVRMCSSINSLGKLSFKMRAFSDIEAFISCTENARVPLLIISSGMESKVIEHKAETVDKAQKVLCLEEPNTPFLELAAREVIAKYQAVDQIIAKIEDMFTEASLDTGECKVVSVFSPNGKIYKTTLALQMAMRLGKRGKNDVRKGRNTVLFISLSEFSNLPQVLLGKGNLSDLFYCFGDEPDRDKVLSVINHGEDFDYILPAPCAEDLELMEAEEFLCCLQYIIAEQSYRYVILDIGSLIKYSCKLFELSDKVIMPSARDDYERIKEKCFMEYLQGSHYSAGASKIISISVPFDEALKNPIAVLNKSHALERLVDSLGF